MISKALRTLARRFASPTFDRRRSFAGSIILTCRETGEPYSLIPAGFGGFYVTGNGGRYLGAANGYTDAMTLIECDARDAVRSLPVAA